MDGITKTKMTDTRSNEGSCNLPYKEDGERKKRGHREGARRGVGRISLWSTLAIPD